MATLQSLDLLYLALALAAILVAVFFCWMLFEIARLIRQANDVVMDVRSKVAQMEDAAAAFKEKLKSSAGMLAMMGPIGKMVFSMMKNKASAGKQKGKKKKSDLYDEEE